MGRLDVNVIPVDEDGESELPEEKVPEEPTDLIGQRIDFIVKINKAIELPDNFCKDVFCEYTFFLSEEKFSTTQIIGKDTNPQFDYRQHHTVEYCSENFVEYLKNDSVSFLVYLIFQLCIKIYGYPDLQKNQKSANKKKSTQKKQSVNNNRSTANDSYQGENSSFEKQ